MRCFLWDRRWAWVPSAGYVIFSGSPSPPPFPPQQEPEPPGGWGYRCWSSIASECHLSRSILPFFLNRCQDAIGTLKNCYLHFNICCVNFLLRSLTHEWLKTFLYISRSSGNSSYWWKVPQLCQSSKVGGDTPHLLMSPECIPGFWSASISSDFIFLIIRVS